MTSEGLTCQHCGEAIHEDAPKIWRHVKHDVVYCEPTNYRNPNVASPKEIQP